MVEALDIPTAAVFEPLLSPARYKGAHGGRGSGKSYFFAGEVISQALDGVTDIVCLREIQRSLDQSAKKLISALITKYGLGYWFDVQDRKIVGPGGNIIIFEGLQNHTADTIKSLEDFRIAWVEEAHSISQVSLDILRPTIRAENSEIWFSWNPRKAEDPVDAFFRGEDAPENAIVVEANYPDNPWFPEVLREDLEADRVRDPDKFAHVWMGQYQKISEALVYKNWIVEKFEPPIGTEFRFGVDWGFANDPTVMIRGFVIGKKLFLDQEVSGLQIPIDIVPDLFSRVPESQKWPCIADSARPEMIDYLVTHGYPLMIPAQKGKGSIEDGIEFIRAYDVVIHPRCKETIKEFSNYSYKIDKYTGQILPKIADGQADHFLDALRYMLESLRRYQGLTDMSEVSVAKTVY